MYRLHKNSPLQNVQTIENIQASDIKNAWHTLFWKENIYFMCRHGTRNRVLGSVMGWYEGKLYRVIWGWSITEHLLMFSCFVLFTLKRMSCGHLRRRKWLSPTRRMSAPCQIVVWYFIVARFSFYSVKVSVLTIPRNLLYQVPPNFEGSGVSWHLLTLVFHIAFLSHYNINGL